MSRIYSKFCGITRLQDAQAAIDSGCDAIGLVMVPKSPRYVTVEAATALAESVKGQVGIVALFANHSQHAVAEAIKSIQPDILQFHGQETVSFCEQWQMPYWKAVPMQDSQEIDAYLQQYASAAAWLLDNYGKNKSGGSGESFAWFSLPEAYRNKLILAGGLTPENVSDAIAQTGTLSVDVSSGIETAPGIKSAAKMRHFIEEIRQHDN